MVGNLVSNVERFTRWVYPGLLLLVLLHFGLAGGLINKLAELTRSDGILLFLLTVIAIVSGNIIYMAYRYGIHLLLQWALFIIGWSDVAEFTRRQRLGRRDAGTWRARLNGVFHTFFIWSNEFSRVAAFEAGADLGLTQHMRNRDYMWGLTHGLGMTWMMLLIASFFVQDRSVLSKTFSWCHWALLIAFLLLIWVGMEWRNNLSGRALAAHLLQRWGGQRASNS